MTLILHSKNIDNDFSIFLFGFSQEKVFQIFVFFLFYNSLILVLLSYKMFILDNIRSLIVNILVS